MPRYKLEIEYDGTPFVGWQRQNDGLSVQGAIEAAIKAFSGEAVSIRGAGRTDAGVHAIGQIAHVDLEKSWDASRVREAINHYLMAQPVKVIECVSVSAGFDARFSASQRHYLYRILTRRAPPVLDRNRVWWVRGHLDVIAMQAAAVNFVGHHDFTTFRAAQCQAVSPIKTLEKFEVTHVGDEIRCQISARSFLHNQVRSMVGSLKLVGEGRWQEADIADALAARDRTRCGTVAPPTGLYLLRVDYPELSSA